MGCNKNMGVRGNWIYFAVLIVVIGVIIIGLYVFRSYYSSSIQAGEENIDVSIRIQGKKMFPDTLRVTQGSNVTLKITSDVEAVLHIHGAYNIEISLTPNRISNATFKAIYPGRHIIALHIDHDELEVGALEVIPR